MAATASAVAVPKVRFGNPSKAPAFSEAAIPFDVYSCFPDSIKVPGSLLALFGTPLGRLYFGNGSYPEHNGIGGWYDANMKNYGLDSNFIGTQVWKNIKLQFTSTGYAMYISDTLVFNQSSTDVILAGTVINYSKVLCFLQNADTPVTGVYSTECTDPYHLQKKKGCPCPTAFMSKNQQLFVTSLRKRLNTLHLRYKLSIYTCPVSDQKQ